MLVLHVQEQPCRDNASVLPQSTDSWLCSQEILSACWAYDLRDRPTFTQLADMLEKLPKLNRRLSHPGHFWKSAE